MVSLKWLFKIKHTVDGSVEKHKAKFVARGFSQKEGLNYVETFVLVTHYISIKTSIAVATIKG